MIGYEVNESFEVPTGLNSIVIELNHEVSRVEGELPGAIKDKWQEICTDKKRELIKQILI